MSGVPKLLIIYGVAIPMAIFLGFLVSAPGMGSLVTIGLLLFLFAIPLLLRHHHLLLILFWNSAFNVFFLPSQPHFWLLLAFLSFGISWLNSIMGEKTFINVPELTRPLFFFGAVVFGTGFLRGGLASRAMGGVTYGGRGYYYILGAILGYFALTGARIPLQKAIKWVGWFFLSSLTYCFSNLVFVLGPSFYILYLLLPPELALNQATAEVSATAIDRISGLPTTCFGVICFLLVRYGLRGTMDWRRPWIAFLFLLAVVGTGFGGFRSAYIVLALMVFFQFFLEGLHRTFYAAVVVAGGTALLLALVAFSNHLPLTMQRAISFVPGTKIDSSVAMDAQNSWQWRLDMWKILLPDVPKYLALGKGYRIDPDELYLADIATQMGMEDSSEEMRISGAYHSGPFSVVLSFGALGTVGFLWFLYAGVKVLHRHYRYGDASLRLVNTLFLAYFLAETVCFIFFVGDIRDSMYSFAGVLGLGVSINGVVRKRAKSREVKAAELQPQLA